LKGKLVGPHSCPKFREKLELKVEIPWGEPSFPAVKIVEERGKKKQSLWEVCYIRIVASVGEN